MPPKKDIASILFHKKKPPVAKAQPKAGPPPQKPRPPKAVAPRKQEEDDDDLHLPDGPYSDYKLFSSALNGWKYDVMKFDSRKPVDIGTWPQPIKLNRKDLRKDDPAASTAGVPVGPMLGADGQPVLQDGKVVMVDAEGRIVQDEATKAKAAPAKKKFQKKTRQVFIVPEETRLLRKEERYPWVLEDGMGKETWVAQLDDTTKAQTHAFFMPAANDVFKFVPAHRWYKFQKKLKHDLPTDTANVEAQYAKHQKRDPGAWLAQRTGRALSAHTAAMFKAEAEGTTFDDAHTPGQSLGPGGRRLKAVDNGMDSLFGDDEDGEGSRRKREREYGEEGDLDEQEYEEEFADDDEKMDVDNDDDEEAKELEERLKKEYKSANKIREGYVDDSDEEEKPKMSKEERRMQKLIRNREGGEPDDSDDEKNPYASSEESSEEEEEIPAQPVSQPPQPTDPLANSQAPQTAKPSTSQPALNGSKSDVRATSPASLSGHSLVAKRATSPKAPKLKPNGGSRGGSPLASRATSPVPVSNSRATSPVAGAGSRAGSPVLQNGKKRKADEGAASPQGSGQVGPPKPKKRKSNAGPVPPLEDRMVIEWLKNTPNASTRDCIQHFTPFLRDEGKKAKFTALVKEVAQLKDGVLVLRAAYRNGGTPASPL
ncbi:transcription initiation factor [Desarmillaria tabescens]|uniref:Transcription initiation factor n=1 Tax=Armillaria tabescens TaxID=1929756 RepID=A0AA39NMM7_ARMTA|nr:transcription initiation factor [Desarmillaria tabescens]KAK0468365.1 transcription initiation factor [Desarmillaria tabescens]